MLSEEFPGFEQISTDGSSLKNGKETAVAGTGVYFGPDDPRNYSEHLGPGLQTNQRAELKGILKALQAIPITQNALIESDSTYSIMCVTEWYYKWELQSWRKFQGKKFPNMELIKPTVRLLEQRKAAGTTTYFRWVKGHADNPGNEAADKLAGDGARREYVRLYGEPQEKKPKPKVSEYVRPGVPFGYRVVRRADGSEDLVRNKGQKERRMREGQARAEERRNKWKNISENRRCRGGSAAQRVAAKAAKAAQSEHEKTTTPDPASENLTACP